MKRIFCVGFKWFMMIIVASSSLVPSFAADYTTAVFSDRIKTLQVLFNGEPMTVPVVELGSTDYVSISFDELSYENSSFYYRIIHCNADWSASELSGMEYLDGFDSNVIDNYDYSVNTTVNYIHYSFSLPNDDVSLVVSGNYAVLIARDNDFDDGIVACACFSVVESMASFAASVSGATMKELNGAYQQLEIEAGIDELQALQPVTDFTLLVRQNGRTDNERLIRRPTYVNGHSLLYGNTLDLVFEAGNQYRSIDFSSRYTYGAGIDHIEFDNGEYQVVLEPSGERVYVKDVYGHDAFGDYVINLQGNPYPEIEADYMWVHFYYPHDYPYIEGEMYLLGCLTGNGMNDGSKMIYDLESKAYHSSLLLKQGGYNFVYALKSEKTGAFTLLSTEGGFWQSSNRYDTYLYYRPFGARYDRLVGYHSIISNR
ncbi:MAG: DUF5103 domain-containing protein [Candidatus Aphodosoma sp.]